MGSWSSTREKLPRCENVHKAEPKRKAGAAREAKCETAAEERTSQSGAVTSGESPPIDRAPVLKGPRNEGPHESEQAGSVEALP